MSNNKTCLPGFNSCEQPITKNVNYNRKDVCLPGFNTCGVPETPEYKAEGKAGKCLPGFNTCTPAEDSEDGSQSDVHRKELLYFSAPWCGHCKAMAPVIDKIAQKYSDAFKLVKVNTEEQPDLANRYEILGVPTIVVKDNEKVVETIVGERSETELLSLLGVQ